MPDNLAHIITVQPYASTLRTVGEEASRLGIEAYAVGGVVRDMLLGRTSTDLDFVTVGQGTGIRLAKSVGRKLGGHIVHVYEKFGTAAIRIPTREDGLVMLEFVAARKESYRRTSRKPLVEIGTLADDQMRRDFTINAIAVRLTRERYGEVIDPFDGRSHLKEQLICTPAPPRRTFADDPLRMIRAARFAAQLGFAIDPAVCDAMRDEAHRVEMLSQERITDELQRIMASDKPSIGYLLLEKTGILAWIFPELHAMKGVETVRGQRHKDNFYHTLQVLDNLVEATKRRPAEDTVWLRWAALLHDIAKPRVKRFIAGTGWTFHGHEDRGARMVSRLFRRLKLPLDERMEYVRKIVALHHRPVALVDDEVTDAAVRRLLFEAGESIDDLMILVRADITSKNPRRVLRYLRAFDEVEKKFAEVEARDRLRNFQPPVDGQEIMEVVGIGEGIAVGIIKEAIRDAILEGEIANEHDAALALLMRIKDEALRRGALFDEIARRLQGPERRAMGAIKEEIFSGDVPEDPAAAWEHMMEVKDRALAATA